MIASRNICSLIVLSLLFASARIALAQAQVPPTVTPVTQSRQLTGQVRLANNGRPLPNVSVTLGTLTATTDPKGFFVISDPPIGYQLVKVDQASVDALRSRTPDGKPASGHLHVDPVLVNIKEGDNPLLFPIYVVEPDPALIPITPGQKTDVVPNHIPQFTLEIPEGVTIKGEDGLPQSGVSITRLAPDRVPKLPDTAAPRTVYLVSFDRAGGGFPTKPVPVTFPNDLNGSPGARVELWFYEKSPAADPQSHQWKKLVKAR